MSRKINDLLFRSRLIFFLRGVYLSVMPLDEMIESALSVNDAEDRATLASEVTTKVPPSGQMRLLRIASRLGDDVSAFHALLEDF